MTVAGRTILVVEDDSMVLTGLQMILESWGMRVLPAEDLPQVLAAIGTIIPDLVLSDLRLREGLNGYDVVDRVRAEMKAEIPAVILTGETGRNDLGGGLGRSRLSLLHKPVQADLLRKAITVALEAVEA